MSGTPKRSERLERILSVQEKKRQLEEWRLADLARRERELHAASAAILESLGDQSLLHGLFLDAKARTLRRNDVEAARLRTQQGEARERLIAAQAAEKRLERAARDARSQEAAGEERRNLESTLDDFLSHRLASFE